MKTQKEMVKETAVLLDSIAWEDAGNLIPTTHTIKDYTLERLDFMNQVMAECKSLLTQRIVAFDKQK